MYRARVSSLLYLLFAELLTRTFNNVLVHSGFERIPGQNDLEYIMTIASNNGKMKSIAGKRGNALSPEDLSDFNRSLSNIKAGNLRASAASLGIVGGAADTAVSRQNSAASGTANLSTFRESNSQQYGEPSSVSSSFQPMMIEQVEEYTVGGSPNKKSPTRSADQSSSAGSLGVGTRSRSKFASVSSLGMESARAASNSAVVSSKSAAAGSSRLGGGGVEVTTTSSSSSGHFSAVSKSRFSPPIGPTSRVLTARGFKSLLHDVSVCDSILANGGQILLLTNLTDVV
jgi:hypothetical protein